MAIIRWDPNSDIQTMRTQFETILREMDRALGGVLPTALTGMRTGTEFMPAVSVVQTQNEVLIECELPGLEQKDVSVSTSPDSITISGEIRKGEHIQERDVLLNERTFGKFTRTLKLPVNIDYEKTRANFRNGLLTITAPLAAEKKARRIQIEE